jgi:four helix bundle protein
MAEMFGHEKLKVYEKTRSFVGLRSELLARIDRRLSACDHLDRGAESILLNIAHASSSWSPKERIVYLGHANGSALECAACLDVFVARMRLTRRDVPPGKSLLREIVSMLIAMKTTAANRVREEHSCEYTTAGDWFFSHEELEVYQTALRFAGWIEVMSPHRSCSTDVLVKLDKSSTAIILNIAEGNGRFSRADHVKFLRIAYKATIQSASLVDVAIAGRSFAGDPMQEGLEMLRQIAAMLTSLAKAVSKDT